MGIFSRKNKQKEDRSMQYSYGGGYSITSYFGDGGPITEEEAMRIPTVVSALELITSSIASLPIYLYKEDRKGAVIKIPDNRVSLLNDEPNDLINGYNMKKRMVKDYLLYGASYIKIEKIRNEVTNFYPLPIKYISVTTYSQGYKKWATINYFYNNKTGTYEFTPDELIILTRDSEDGVTSSGILQNNSKLLRLALDEIEYSNGILKNGALPIGVLKATSRLSQKAIDNLRSSWENLYSGPKKAGKTIILEEGLDYNPISMKPSEMDLTNSKKNTVSEIARVFNIPESMLNSSANKYASNEQNNLYFLQYCVGPIISAIESALNKSLLLETEKEQGYYFRFDVSELLRTTEKEKIDATVSAVKGGLISLNEGRSRIDMPEIKDDFFMWGLGQIFYNPKTGKMTIPNMGETIDPNNPQPSAQNQNHPPTPSNLDPNKPPIENEQTPEDKDDSKIKDEPVDQ